MWKGGTDQDTHLGILDHLELPWQLWKLDNLMHSLSNKWTVLSYLCGTGKELRDSQERDYQGKKPNIWQQFSKLSLTNMSMRVASSYNHREHQNIFIYNLYALFSIEFDLASIECGILLSAHCSLLSNRPTCFLARGLTGCLDWWCSSLSPLANKV